ncbi:hypothetical protein G6L09_08135 [Agrobacterium rhizogenes]|nr:hypothetical protein [Rhizobium rhizogenes]NTH70525.1 hypothetical protein [Rhizobium rhizogenes]NTJ00292.1 hypothetical protein [Rhizobium rhizogenes]
MSFQPRTTDELVRIALAGGAIEMDVAARTTDDLVRIALAAGKGGGTWVFKGLYARTTDDLVRISLAAKGNVRFV